jgi:hypothetical protein
LFVCPCSAREQEGRKIIQLMIFLSIKRKEKGRPRQRSKSLFGDTKYLHASPQQLLSGEERSRSPDTKGVEEKAWKAKAHR